MTEAPPLHPLEREQLQQEARLVVTVRTDEEFRDDVEASIEALERGEDVDAPPTIAFESYDELLSTFMPRVLELIETVRAVEPESINATARAVSRDVKNVHEELARLARQGVIFFEEDGRRKRPVVWFDELVIALPFDRDMGEATTVA